MTIGQGFHAKSPPTHYLLALGVNFAKCGFACILLDPTHHAYVDRWEKMLQVV